MSGLVLITSDIHVHDKWFEKSAKFFEFLKEVILEYKPSHFFHLGDLFESKDHISNQCKKLVIDFLKFLSTNKVYSSFLVGNHDVARWDGEEPITTTYFISGYDYATEIRKPVLVNVLSKSILFIPYLPQYTAFEEVLSNVHLNKGEKIDYIFMHGDIKGYSYPSGQVSKDGWDLREFQCRIKMLCGHYHLPNINKGLIGSPYMRDFRDAFSYNNFNEFGVYLVDFSKSRFNYKFIPFESEYYVKLAADDLEDFERKLKVLKKNYQGKTIWLWVKQKQYFEVKREELREEIDIKNVLVTGSFEVGDEGDGVGEDEDRGSKEMLFFSKEVLQRIIEGKIPREYKKNKRFLEIGNQLFQDLG